MINENDVDSESEKLLIELQLAAEDVDNLPKRKKGRLHKGAVEPEDIPVEIPQDSVLESLSVPGSNGRVLLHNKTDKRQLVRDSVLAPGTCMEFPAMVLQDRRVQSALRNGWLGIGPVEQPATVAEQFANVEKVDGFGTVYNASDRNQYVHGTILAPGKSMKLREDALSTKRVAAAIASGVLARVDI